jgi:GT2 family glycosyltransferase
MTTTPNTPAGVSIIVPNYNSSRYLARLLDSIDGAGKPDLPFEILVVDDSGPEEAQAAQALCVAHGATFLHCRGRVGAKRNFGGQAARYSLLLFVDSDCEFSTGLLREHAKLNDEPPENGAMLGPVEFPGEDSFMWRAVERSQFLGPYSFARRMMYAPWGGAGNLSVRKSAYQAIGGFDSGFLQVPGGEDVDLGLRLNDAGFRIRCNPDALMCHTRETWQDSRKMLRRAFGYGRAHAHILDKHKERTGHEFPRPAVVLLLVAFCSALGAILAAARGPLLWTPILLAAVLMAQSAFQMLLHRRRWTPISLAHELAGQWLNLVFDAGLVYEILRGGFISQLFRKIIYAQGQLVHERDGKILQMWSIVIGLMALLLVATFSG